MRYLIVLLILCFWFGNADCAEIQTARGPQTINNGDTVYGNSKWSGTIDGLENVTFVSWNFSQQNPHTQLFINCSNLTFIDCNLNNVELQSDFTVDGCLTIHQRTYKDNGKDYKEIECGDNKTRTYEMTEEDIDVIERDFKTLSLADKQKIRDKYEEEGVETTIRSENQVLVNIEETPNDKKITAIRISN